MEKLESHELTPDDEVSHQSFPKKKRFVDYLWKDFVSSFTLHGFHFIFEKRSLIQRFLWFLFLLLMSVLFVWQMSMLVLSYFEYKITSSVKYVSERQNVFPAVTICNFNQYRKSAMEGNRLKEIVRLNNPLYRENSEPFNWTSYSYEVNNMDMEKTVRSVGHQLKYENESGGGMLYNCVWKGQKCSHLNFTTILTDMGVCYTFNSGKLRVVCVKKVQIKNSFRRNAKVTDTI